MSLSEKGKQGYIKVLKIFTRHFRISYTYVIKTMVNNKISNMMTIFCFFIFFRVWPSAKPIGKYNLFHEWFIKS